MIHGLYFFLLFFYSGFWWILVDLNDLHRFPMVSNNSIVFHTQVLVDFSCYTLVLRGYNALAARHPR